MLETGYEERRIKGKGGILDGWLRKKRKGVVLIVKLGGVRRVELLSS